LKEIVREKYTGCALCGEEVLCKELLLLLLEGLRGMTVSATGWKLVKALATRCSGRCLKTAKSRFQVRLEKVTTALQKKIRPTVKWPDSFACATPQRFKMLLLRIHRVAQLALPEPFDPHGPKDANLPRSTPRGIMMTHG
jgi:hypothetical protein